MQTVSRLLDTFVPENYQLSLTLDRTGRKFEGTVTIKGVSTPKSNDIRFHAKDLAIESVVFDGKEAQFTLETDDELAITHPDITEGKHIVVIGFSGAITDSMHGLYPCYFEHEGIKKELLATQFESHHAREVFPCIDEPSAKATFDVTLTTETDVTVLGNMPVLSQNEENSQLVTTFNTTPKMSSYLLAWVVGELHKKTATTKSGVEVNIWATPAQPASSLDFALGIATRTIDFFDDYFDTPYPLPKSDHVALPDFSSGAMENWGLITYREVALLADPKTTSLSNKHMIATVIAHELSHQWFGNLVTMKWWNDLWLNESFANMMEYLAVDALEPSWEVWLEHASLDVLSALRRDSLEGVQSIRTDVHHPDEIGTMFDSSIVYAKGGRLLRMLQTYVGDEVFQAGLKLYFQKFAYQNTEADDLWECLAEASGQDIDTFMDTWIDQSGYPVVHVSDNNGEITLRQEQFFIGEHAPSDKLWPIPLNSTCSEIPKLLTDRQVTVKRTHQTPLRFNAGATAHFITHYSPELLNRLLDTITDLPDIDRLYLLHEQTLLAQAGIISTADLITILEHYKNETEEAVWDIMSLAVSELKKFVETDPAAEKKLRALAGNLAEAQFMRLGWDRKDNEPDTDTKLRSVIVSLMLYSERQEVLDAAASIYASRPIDELDPELRSNIMASVVRHSQDQTIVDALLKLYQETSNSELQEDIAIALTATKDPATIDRIIGLFKNQAIIRQQDFLRWFIWLLRNRYGRDTVWQWCRDNWQWLTQTFKTDMSYDSFPRYIASSLMTTTHLEQYKAFFEPLKSEIGLRRNIAIGIGELSGRVALIERDGPTVRKALLDL
ncbi:MAG: M1 family metallopeptidase [Candidatus Microsaccharimonas sp.]